MLGFSKELNCSLEGRGVTSLAISMVAQFHYLYFIFIILCANYCAASVDGENEESPFKERAIKYVDSISGSVNIKEGRVTRGIGSKKHLRKGDADRVASYFLNGGPLVGHSHFVRAASQNCDLNNDNNLVGMGSNINYGQQPTIWDKSFINPVVGASHISAYVPGVPPVYPYTYESPHPITGQLNPTVGEPVNNWHSPFNNLLGSVLNLHPNTPRLPNIHHTLLRTATLPFHGIAHAHSMFKHLFSPPIVGTPNIAQGNAKSNDSMCLNGQDVYAAGKAPTDADALKVDPLTGSPNPTVQSNNDLQNAYLYYPNMPPGSHYSQPSGYIVKVVPHVPSTNQIINSPTEPTDGTNDAPSTTEEPQSEKSSAEKNENDESKNTTKIKENIVNNEKNTVTKREKKTAKKL